MLLAVNTFLLSIFAQDARFGTDVKSFLKRNRILSIIYANLGLSFVVVGYEAGIMFVLHLWTVSIYTPSLLVALGLSFYFLRKGKTDSAAAVTVLFMHFINYISGSYFRTPLAALFGLMLFPNLTMLVYPSYRMRVLHVILGCAQSMSHIMDLKEIFKTTFTNEQAEQISTSAMSSFFCLTFVYISCVINKTVEDKLWQIAYSDYSKVEQLTKEVVEAVEGRDSFLLLFSSEIKNHLTSMNESIAYLSRILKEPHYLQAIDDAKIGGETLLSLVDNMLDALKLKSEKLEMSYSEVNFEEIINKTMVMNSKNLRTNQVFSQVSIDKNLPKNLKLDPSRLLQIMMNLVSTSIKFARKETKLRLDALWCSSDQDKASLLAPIKDFDKEISRESRKERGLSSSFPLISTEKIKISRTESSVFSEFSNEGDEERWQNLQSVRHFETKALSGQGLNNFTWAKAGTDPYVINRVHYQLPQRKRSFSRQDINPPGRKRYLKVHISNEGPGIPEEDVPKIFETFNQTLYTGEAINRGLGFGLWVCKQICQRMGGDIIVHNTPGRGTSFVFYIPADMSDILGSVPSTSDMLRDTVNVMVVDDYHFNRDLHKLLLEREGVQVTLASDGKEAVDKYQAQGEGYFDFIMMDIQMPVMDGFTATKVIKEYEDAEGFRKKVDVCFVSGEYFHEDEVLAKYRIKEKGKDSTEIRCLRKPIDLEIIRRLVNLYKIRIKQNQVYYKREDEDEQERFSENKESEIRYRKS